MIHEINAQTYCESWETWVVEVQVYLNLKGMGGGYKIFHVYNLAPGSTWAAFVLCKNRFKQNIDTFIISFNFVTSTRYLHFIQVDVNKGLWVACVGKLLPLAFLGKSDLKFPAPGKRYSSASGTLKNIQLV